MGLNKFQPCEDANFDQHPDIFVNYPESDCENMETIGVQDDY